MPMSRNSVSTIIAVVIALVGWLLFAMGARQQDDLESEIAALRASSTAAVARAEQSDADLELAGGKAEALEAEVRTLRDDVAALVEEKQALATRVSERESAIAALEERVRLAEARSGELEAATARALAAEQNLDNEFAALGTRSRRMQHHLEGLLAEQLATIGALERDRRDRDQRIRQLLADADSLQRERDAMAARIAAAAEAAAAVEQPQAAVENNELGELQQAYAALRDEHEALKARLVSEQQQRSGVKVELDAERDRVAESASALEAAIADRDEVRRLLADARDSAERTADLEARLGQADQEIAQRTRTLQQERARVADLEASMEEINRRSEELVAELQAKEELVARLNRERDQARDELRLLQSEIRQVVEQKELEIRQIQDRVTLIRMDSDIVFGFGSTLLSDAGRRVLDSVASFAGRSPDRVISLEGHTDSVPIGQDRQQFFPSNWELSSARAAAAARYLESRGIDPARLRIVGYGQHRPVAENDSEDGRRANRRLEIVLAPAATAAAPGTGQ